MAIDTDFHNHISYTSAAEMIQAAKQKGLRVFALSEHVFQMSETRELLGHMMLEGSLSTIPNYIKSVRVAAQNYQCDVRLGLEVDFIPNKKEQIQLLLHHYDWDFLIGSIHQVDEVIFEIMPIIPEEQGVVLWRRYFQLLHQAVSSSYFSVISHPIRMRFTNPYMPSNIDDEFEHLAAEATRYNVALEINGKDVRSYPDIVRRLAKACAICHTPISIGSDAHYPEFIAESHQMIETILREVGLQKIRIWKGREPEEYYF